MDTTSFLKELSRGFMSSRTPFEQGASLSVLILFFVLLILIVVIVMLYLKLRKADSDIGNVDKHRKMLINSIKKHLTGSQIKLLEDISVMLKLENAEKLFHDTFFFEHSIDRFLKLKFETGDINESMDLLYRSIVETYEKIYHFSKITTPLNNISDLEINRLIYIISHDNRFFIGKLVSASNHFKIDILGGVNHLDSLYPYSDIICYIWRAGDAHYNFKSSILLIDGRQLEITIPETFKRFEDEHHPLIDVNLECSIFMQNNLTSESQNEPSKKISGVIFKLNESELILRSNEKLEFYKGYTVSFQLNEYNLVVDANIIRDRILKDTQVHYYNFKTIKISPESKNIIRKHIENMHSQGDLPVEKGKYSKGKSK
jgi:hypothetical protein